LCAAGRVEPFSFSTRRIKIRFVLSGGDKIVSGQFSIQAVCRKRFLKSCDTRKRCSWFGDNFLPRPSDLNFDLPLPFGFGARRERSQFNKNQNTLLKIIFFIFFDSLRYFRAFGSFAARFVQSIIARLMPQARNCRQPFDCGRRNADKIEGKTEKAKVFLFFEERVRESKKQAAAWRNSTRLRCSATTSKLTE
jgi:hypothetical protein